MLEFKLGCYKSYPLIGISSRDAELASKEIQGWDLVLLTTESDFHTHMT